MLITMITFQKAQDRARSFPNTQTAFIFTLSDTECCVWLWETIQTSHNAHYCTLMQILFPEIPTQHCKYMMPSDCVREH